MSEEKLQPPDPALNHFERLGLERKFTLDEDALSQAVRTLQRKVHPDRFAAKSERERMLAAQHSTAINDAQRVLSDPTRRAIYLLQLAGRDLDAQDEGRVQLDPMFLMEVIEIREAVSELEGPDAHVERRQMAREVAGRREQILNGLGKGLDAVNWPPNDVLLDGLVQEAAQLRYLDRILDEIARLDGLE